MGTISENREEFMSLCSDIKREGIDKLIDWLDKSDFFAAPASSRYHGNYEGGLLEHSLNVYHELKRLIAAYPELNQYFSFVCNGDIEDSVKIISLFHDLCKVYNYGVEKRNRKNNEGKWEQYDCYTTDEAFEFGGHGSKSVYIIQSFIKLTPEEATAINCHMGAFSGDVNLVAKAFGSCPLAWLLSVADQSASYITEGFSKSKSEIWAKRTKWTDGFITQKVNQEGE